MESVKSDEEKTVVHELEEHQDRKHAKARKDTLAVLPDSHEMLGARFAAIRERWQPQKPHPARLTTLKLVPWSGSPHEDRKRDSDYRSS
jgi:hypothetical protein